MSRLTRRRLLAGSAGAMTLAALPACGSAARRTTGRVVVAGLGLAGLTAAVELRERGWEVVAVEARDRVGGRVRTVRRPFAAGQHGEAGAEYVDTGHAAMRGLCKRFGLRLQDVRPFEELDGMAYLDGRREPDSELRTPLVEAELTRLEARIDALAEEVDLADLPGTGRALDERSAADLFDELRLDPTARFLAEVELRDEYTVEASQLSLLFLVLGFLGPAAEQPASGAEAFRIRGGNDQLPRALADELPKISLRSPVTAVRRSATGVAVVVDGETVRADYAVLAAPLPALRPVEFSPALPEPLGRAVAELAYGTGVKTLLQYRRRFWRAAGFSADVITDLPFQTSWEATDGQRGTPGIFLGYTVGAGGTRLGEIAAAERVPDVAAEVDRIYPGSAALRAASATLAWQDEPYSGGTYSAFAPGQVTAFWDALRRPAGRVYLAGEHTDIVTGYMEGAVRSGRRVARAIDRRGR